MLDEVSCLVHDHALIRPAFLCTGTLKHTRQTMVLRSFLIFVVVIEEV